MPAATERPGRPQRAAPSPTFGAQITQLLQVLPAALQAAIAGTPSATDSLLFLAADGTGLKSATIVDIVTAGGGGGGGGGGAPTNADYLVKTANASLSAERVVTDTSTVAWDFATPGQAAAAVPDSSLGTVKLGGDITAAGKALLDDASAAAQRTTLGLGTAATQASTAFDAAGTAASAVTVHEAAADPHVGYQKESEKGAANGYAGLDAGGLVPLAQLPSLGGGTPPTGTGFRHTTVGVEDPTAQKVELDNANHVDATTKLPIANGGTNLGSYAKGDVLYADAANSLKALAAGSDGQALVMAASVPAWAWGTPQVLAKTADQTFASATAANVTGMSFAVTAGQYYHFKFVLLVQSNTATVGVRATVTIPAATRFGAEARTVIAADGTAATYLGAISSSGDAVVPTAVPAINTDYVLIVEGCLLPSASGTLQLQAGTETGTTNVIVRQGSVGFLTRIA